jgi:hypothetical protein
MTTTLDATLDAMAVALFDPDLSEDARYAIAIRLTTLATQAREGRLLITPHGTVIGVEPMREAPPARISGATPGRTGTERLFRERG